MQDIVTSLTNMVNGLLSYVAPHNPPGSSIFIIIVAVGITVLSTVISRKFIDLKKLKLYTKKTKEYQKLQRKALRAQDPILKKKVENQKATFQRMQSELMKMRMKPMLFTFLPLILIFFSLNAYYNNTSTNNQNLVANIPFDLPETVIFQFGVNCPYQRNAGIANSLQSHHLWFSNDTVINSPFYLNATQWNSLGGYQKLCLQNPSLHYMPTYIGWYVLINVVINSLITKVAGLMPD